MSVPSREQIDGWWQLLTDHQQRDGRCPRCRSRRRCWERATAMAELIAHDVYHLGPPAPARATAAR